LRQPADPPAVVAALVRYKLSLSPDTISEHAVRSSPIRPFFAVFALAAALLALPAQARAPQVEAEAFTLPNGMKFVLVPRRDQPNTISAGWLAKVGSVNERPGITGISHFFEHMMFKGTNTIGTRDAKRDAEYRLRQKEVRDRINGLTWRDQYARYFAGEIDDPWNPANDTDELRAARAELKALMDSQQGKLEGDAISSLKQALAKVNDDDEKGKISDEIARLEAAQKEAASIVKDEFDTVYTKNGGSGMNAFTSHDLTFYFITVPSNKFELWAWMESDRLADSVFREFYAERDVVHEERRLRTESTPTGIYDEQFDAMFWMSSGYSWPVIGWSSDLNSYTMEEAMRYWDIYYRPNNLVGFVVGDFDAAEARATIERYFSRLRKGEMEPPPVVTLEHKQVAEMRMVAEVEAQPSVEIRYHTVPYGHRDSYALDVLASVLNGRTGRLYKSMVEGSGIASSAASGQDARKYAGYFAFTAETKGDATPAKLEEAWYAELKRLQDGPVAERELQKVKNQAAADQYRRLQSNLFLMIQLGMYESMGSWQDINTENAKIQAVTPEDLQRVARTYFGEKNRAVATYLRKAGTATGGDAELAALPAPMQAMARQALKQLESITDPALLRQQLAAMDAQAAQVPPQMKPVFDFLRTKLEARLETLEDAADDADD
jgi:predicted Zn-dependent peptidase